MAELLASWWVIGIIFTLLFSFGTGPMVLFYFAWRIHRNIARIADALEVAERSRQDAPPVEQAPWPAQEIPSRRHIFGSAFGR